VQVLRAFHDGALDVDCAFADGLGSNVGAGPVFYCLPVGAARHREGSGPFADASCTVPLAIPAAGSAPAYAVIEPANACRSAPVVRRALAPARVRPYALSEDGLCVRASAASPLAKLGDEIPLERFVSAVEEIRPSGDARIAARVLVATDGAEVVVGGFDRARGEASQAVSDPSGAPGMVWLPQRLAFVGAGNERFAGAACDEPLATKVGHDAACPLSAVFAFTDACGGGVVRELGGAVSPSRRRDASGACVDGGDAVLAFRAGEAIPLDRFARAVTIDVGEGPAARRGVVGPGGGAPVVWTAVVDRATGEPCVAADAGAPGGARRCLPADGEDVSLFADAACAEPAFARASLGACDARVPRPRFVRDTATGRAFAVGRAVSSLFAMKGGACVPFEPLVPSAAFAASEVKVEQFPLVEARSD
jgi:hypothetical protein